MARLRKQIFTLGNRKRKIERESDQRDYGAILSPYFAASPSLRAFDQAFEARCKGHHTGPIPRGTNETRIRCYKPGTLCSDTKRRRFSYLGVSRNSPVSLQPTCSEFNLLPLWSSCQSKSRLFTVLGYGRPIRLNHSLRVPSARFPSNAQEHWRYESQLS